MYCPKCRSTVTNGSSKCEKCNVKLVTRLSPIKRNKVLENLSKKEESTQEKTFTSVGYSGAILCLSLFFILLCNKEMLLEKNENFAYLFPVCILLMLYFAAILKSSEKSLKSTFIMFITLFIQVLLLGAIGAIMRFL